MSRTLFTNARILTLAPTAHARTPRRGLAMRELGVIERGHLLVENGRIAALGAGAWWWIAAPLMHWIGPA